MAVTRQMRSLEGDLWKALIDSLPLSKTLSEVIRDFHDASDCDYDVKMLTNFFHTAMIPPLHTDVSPLDIMTKLNLSVQYELPLSDDAIEVFSQFATLKLAPGPGRRRRTRILKYQLKCAPDEMMESPVAVQAGACVPVHRKRLADQEADLDEPDEKRSKIPEEVEKDSASSDEQDDSGFTCPTSLLWLLQNPDSDSSPKTEGKKNDEPVLDAIENWVSKLPLMTPTETLEFQFPHLTPQEKENEEEESTTESDELELPLASPLQLLDLSAAVSEKKKDEMQLSSSSSPPVPEKSEDRNSKIDPKAQLPLQPESTVHESEDSEVIFIESLAKPAAARPMKIENKSVKTEYPYQWPTSVPWNPTNPWIHGSPNYGYFPQQHLFPAQLAQPAMNYSHWNHMQHANMPMNPYRTTPEPLPPNTSMRGYVHNLREIVARLNSPIMTGIQWRLEHALHSLNYRDAPLPMNIIHNAFDDLLKRINC